MPLSTPQIDQPSDETDDMCVQGDAEHSAPLSRVMVTPWSDPVIDTVGHDPRSEYVERFWLAVLGPSTLLLFRRLALAMDAQPDGFAVDLTETAGALGLSSKGRRATKMSPVMRALTRSCTFGVARQEAPDAFAIRRRFPPLTRRQLDRLPQGLQAEHQAWTDRDIRRDEVSEMRARARQIALSLVELGEPYDDVERQLHRWRFHPAVAHEAVRWAHDARVRTSTSAGV